jgi:hypothetical protein
VLTARLLIGGIAALYVGVTAVLLWRRRRLGAEVAGSRTWPSTPGTVVQSQLHERSTSRAGREYIPRVVYEYRVDGQTYRSGQLHFGEPIAYSLKRRAERRLATLTASAGRVFYDPANPARAVVERSAPVLRRDAVLLLVVAVVFAGGVVALLAELS